MNKGQWGRLRDTEAGNNLLIFEAVPDLRLRAHFAHRFFHTHRKIDNIPSIEIYTYSIYTIIYSIIYIYNKIIINYIYSIYIVYSICNIPRIYNILCNIKNRWTQWARGLTTVKPLSTKGFETFANAPTASTRPHFLGFVIKGNTLSPDISAFLVGCRAFLTISLKCPEISAFFSLVSHLLREGKPKMFEISAFSPWFQRLSNKNNQKGLILQASYKTKTIHISKSDLCIKISEDNNDE